MINPDRLQYFRGCRRGYLSRRLLSVIAVVIVWLLSLAGRVQAHPSNLRASRPSAVMPELGLALTPPAPLPGYASLGLTLSHAPSRHLALDATVGWGLPASALSRSQGEDREVSMSTGIHGRGLLRGVLPIGADQAFALSLGIGPGVISGGAFGTVLFARGEAAIEWRGESGITLLLGLGYDLAFNDSRTPIGKSACLTADCPTHFVAGQGQVAARYAVGYAF